MPPLCSMLGSNLAHSSDWPSRLSICFVIRVLEVFFCWEINHISSLCLAVWSGDDFLLCWLKSTFFPVLYTSLWTNFTIKLRSFHFIQSLLCWIQIYEANLINKATLQIGQSNTYHLSHSVCLCIFLSFSLLMHPHLLSHLFSSSRCRRQRSVPSGSEYDGDRGWDGKPDLPCGV